MPQAWVRKNTSSQWCIPVFCPLLQNAPFESSWVHRPARRTSRTKLRFRKISPHFCKRQEPFPCFRQRRVVYSNGKKAIQVTMQPGNHVRLHTDHSLAVQSQTQRWKQGMQPTQCSFLEVPTELLCDILNMVSFKDKRAFFVSCSYCRSLLNTPANLGTLFRWLSAGMWTGFHLDHVY